MKKLILAVVVAVVLTVVMTSPVFAGGDKVRGEKGLGEVHQVQVQDPPPFQ